MTQSPKSDVRPVGKAQTEGKNVARDGRKKEDRESKNGLNVSARAPTLSL
jgi:hypothetical protein